MTDLQVDVKTASNKLSVNDVKNMCRICMIHLENNGILIFQTVEGQDVSNKIMAFASIEVNFLNFYIYVQLLIALRS